MAFFTQPGLGRGFGSCVWGALCVIPWGPWPWRTKRKSSEPDRTVRGRAEQPLSSRGTCLVVKKKKKEAERETDESLL